MPPCPWPAWPSGRRAKHPPEERRRLGGRRKQLVPGLDLATQSRILIWLSGLGFAALFVFPGAMMADVIDDDTRRSGRRRAGAYYGMFKTLEKLAQGASAILFGALLSIFGYTADRSLGIQLTLPVAGVCAIAAFVTVILWYHLRGSDESAADLEAATA